MKHVWIIVRKEWEEVFRQRVVLLTVAFMPTMLTGLGLGTLATLSGVLSSDEAAQKAADPDLVAMMGDSCAQMSAVECTQAFIATLYLLILLILPLALPSAFAAQSIVGEKTSRTLEPLLATPISTLDLLLGKVVAAAAPAVAVTWLAGAVYVAGCWAILAPAAFARVLEPQWAAALVVLAPLLAVFSTLVAVMISSRSTDPRIAQQTASLVVLPVVALMVGQSVGLVVVRPGLVAAACAVTLLLDVGLGWLSVQIFEREAILTRWR